MNGWFYLYGKLSTAVENQVLWQHVAPYGWLITTIAFLLYITYRNVFKPRLENMWQLQERLQQKKFDEEIHSRIAARLEAARVAQQRKHDAITKEAKRLAEEAARKKHEQAEDGLRRSVLENTLMSHSQKLSMNRQLKQRSPAEIIDESISAKPVVMFSLTMCPFCRKAKAALATFRLQRDQFEYIELDERHDLPKNEIQDEFARRYGSRSFPKVFIGGKFVGGGDEIVRLLHTGELEELVRAAVELN